MLLMLAHMFRRLGPRLRIDDAVEFLSFRCRFGRPTEIRKMLALAEQREMISRHGEEIQAEFLFDRQAIPPTIVSTLENAVKIRDEVSPMY